MEQLDIFAPGNKIWNEGFKMISTKSGTQPLYEARRFEVDGARGSIPSISTTHPSKSISKCGIGTRNDIIVTFL